MFGLLRVGIEIVSYELGSEDLEAGLPDELKVAGGVEMAPVHRCPVELLNLTGPVARSHAKQQHAAWPEHPIEAPEQRRVLVARDVDHGVEAADAVEAAVGEVELRHVGTVELRIRHQLSGELDLRFGDIDAGYRELFAQRS